MQNKGIYLIEPKEITEKNSNDKNTWAIVKDLLKPLIQKYRKQIIKAKINANPKELTKYIGEDNYEELVDAINCVDNLGINEQLINKLDTDEDCSTIKNIYNEQVERINKIYQRIGIYNASLYEEQRIETTSAIKAK